jgi:hypothetical protein
MGETGAVLSSPFCRGDAFWFFHGGADEKSAGRLQCLPAAGGQLPVDFSA